MVQLVLQDLRGQLVALVELETLVVQDQLVYLVEMEELEEQELLDLTVIF